MSRSILDPKFKYTSSSNTDIRKTFKRIRKEQKRSKSDGSSVVAIRKSKSV